MKWLLILAPISFYLGSLPTASPVWVFFISGIAIVPVAHLITESTEQLARRLGDAKGGLLNASFGNFPELIITLVALRAGQNELVAGSLIGGILANLVLAQGLSFFAGGLKFHIQEYNVNSTRLFSSMMLLSVASLAIPSAFQKGAGAAQSASFTLNLVIAFLLLLMYFLFLVFTLRTHPELFSARDTTSGHEEHTHTWSMQRAFLTLIGASVLAAFLSEVLVSSAEGAGKSLGMSQAFIGLICVAVVGGAAESLSAISMAMRNRMDLSLGISLGSSIQIALFIAPLLVLSSYFIAPAPFLLVFDSQLLIFLLLAVLLSSLVAGDGKSTWYKGMQLILLYVMLGAALYLLPG